MGVLFDSNGIKVWQSRGIYVLDAAIRSVRHKSYKLGSEGIKFQLPDFEALRVKAKDKLKPKSASWDNTCYRLTPEEYYKRLEAEKSVWRTYDILGA